MPVLFCMAEYYATKYNKRRKLMILLLIYDLLLTHHIIR